MSKGQQLQDPFLNALRQEQVQVSVYLVNGIKLQGVIESFDPYVVLLKNAVTQMVYKHAISTVVPARPCNAPVPPAKPTDTCSNAPNTGRRSSWPPWISAIRITPKVSTNSSCLPPVPE